MLNKTIGNLVLNSLSRNVRRFSAAQAANDLHISARCADRIKQLERQRNKTVVLRVTVDGGGCSGFQYGFQLEDWEGKPSVEVLQEDDKLFQKDGAYVIVDDISLAYISGSKVDYIEEMISCSFQVRENPNSATSCGCGVSFSPKQ